MIVVSDASGISNLIQVGQIDLLRKLYGELLISPGVYRELVVMPAQMAVLNTLDWITSSAPANQELIVRLINERNLDLGEAESIALALERNADVLVIDESLGRKVALDFRIQIIGVLGVLIKAKQEGIIDYVRPIIDDLLQIGFRLHPSLVNKVLKQLGEALD